jgi:hypothetical protein
MAECLQRRAGLLQWRWQLTKESRDLEAAIGGMERALAQRLETRRLASDAPAGLIAQIRVKRMLTTWVSRLAAWSRRGSYCWPPS